ncbi:phosphonopyruvate decarboxylase [Pseudoalteromonas sp. DL2-H2.2]|uniref:phosphonopyruvate decarboxylase n=1 Tax=Pseudoalteromonas sp. DL2-H2.2 TaxID=2908889 RepID=UPI001F35045A|nr:phosphonopyruvate decarboxylase [Pseudoalteromonas sp. DL2-H2.2]MCF2909717.1 phosphonopyruvate decarboxylase [Pseudoalteromonas sp. DL2-H2.2]
MISICSFHHLLAKHDVDFFTGVPDSLLSTFSQYLESVPGKHKHIIAANEGNAVGLAIGHHLATSKIPMVYMQNSGLGNAYNPLISLADPEVYSIPMVLLVGWRGQPGVKDEPQHKKQGLITKATLEAMDIPYVQLSPGTQNVEQKLETLFDKINQKPQPVAILVEKGTFINDLPTTITIEPEKENPFTREKAIKTLLDNLPEHTKIVSTTGMASRELYELREQSLQSHSHDFLSIGGMGHASQIALGLAISNDAQVLCIDGDGSALMHMGSFALNGQSQLSNFKHVILNNGCHDSVGGQATVGLAVELTQIARACGYVFATKVSSEAELISQLSAFWSHSSPALLEIVISRGHRANLGRPTQHPIESKLAFMRHC